VVISITPLPARTPQMDVAAAFFRKGIPSISVGLILLKGPPVAKFTRNVQALDHLLQLCAAINYTQLFTALILCFRLRKFNLDKKGQTEADHHRFCAAEKNEINSYNDGD
jgi:hypothetical protein